MVPLNDRSLSVRCNVPSYRPFGCTTRVASPRPSRPSIRYKGVVENLEIDEVHELTALREAVADDVQSGSDIRRDPTRDKGITADIAATSSWQESAADSECGLVKFRRLRNRRPVRLDEVAVLRRDRVPADFNLRHDVEARHHRDAQGRADRTCTKVRTIDCEAVADEREEVAAGARKQPGPADACPPARGSEQEVRTALAWRRGGLGRDAEPPRLARGNGSGRVGV